MSGSTQNGDGTTVTQLDPQIKQAWLDQYKRAQDTAGALPDDIPNKQIADLNRDYTGANAYLDNQTVGSGIDSLNRAQTTAWNATQYKPRDMQAASVQDPGNVSGRDVGYVTADAANLGNAAQARARDTGYLTGDAKTAGNFTQAQKETAGNYQGADQHTIDRGSISNVDPGSVVDHLGQYKDPYQQQVVNQTMQELERSRNIAQQNDKSSAIAAHAFGGSREGVQRAQTNEAYDRTGAQTLANLNSQGFTQATQLRAQDVSNDMNAQGQNQQADLGVFGQNAAFKNQNDQFNAGQQAQREQFNASNKQATELFNAEHAGTREEYNANQKQGMELANLGYGNTARQQTAASENAANLYNAQAQNQREEYGAAQKNQIGLANMGAANTARSQTAANDQQARLAQYQGDLSRNITDAGYQQDASKTNQAMDLAGSQQRLQAAQQLGALGNTEHTMRAQDVGLMNDQGKILQDYQQSRADADYQNRMAEYQQPIERLQVAGSPFSMLPSLNSGGSSNTNSSGKGIGI